MNILLVAVILVAAASGADSPSSAPAKKDPSKLAVGDPAPALKASKWLQGQEIKEFEPGKVYAVEFWATWCGPCLMIMPHLAELQAQYLDKGVTFIGYSARDPNNTEEKVAAFVQKRGPKLKHTFAYADDRTSYDAWMKAAGQNGIPCAFVVDQTGRIAFIGHPLFLGIVLPKVLARNATGEAIASEVNKIQEEIAAVGKSLSGPEPKAGLQALKDFETKYPPLANNPYWLREKLGALMKAGQMDEAKSLAETVVARAIDQEDPMDLRIVSMALCTDEGKQSKELMAVAVKAAEGVIKVEGKKDARALINLATTYSAAGDNAKAKEVAQKAIEAASGESDALKQYIEKQAKKIDDEKGR